MDKKRIYKYDNIKALLIFLVVIGHMTTDYVSDSHMVRWITLWIYSFHMPAFIFISGLVHKQYITEERAALGVKGETHLRWDKIAGFFLCGYGLKVFLQFTRTLMGQHPLWHWIAEPGIPWYLFVMAEYELLFYVMRHIDGGGRKEHPTISGNEANAGTGSGGTDGRYSMEQDDGGGGNSIRNKARSTDGMIASAAQCIGNIQPAIMILGAFTLSAVIGYFPAVGDTFCLSRMINFLPIYMIGYYLDMNKFLEWVEGKKYGAADEPHASDLIRSASEDIKANYSNIAPAKIELHSTGVVTGSDNNRNRYRKTAITAISWIVIISSMAVCCLGKWGMYSWRKWFTGRRSYEFLQDYFSYAVRDGWWIRIAVWLVALCITLAIISLIPDKDLGFITTIGSRTLSVYFWHRPICYLFRNWKILPRLCVLLGGTYNDAVAGQIKGLAFGGSTLSMAAALVVYMLIGAGMTALFSFKIFEHPTSDLMKLGARIAGNRKI